MKNRLLCVLLSLAMAVSLWLPYCAVSVSANTGEDVESTQPEKVYCTATLEDEFTEDEVLIIVYPQWKNKQYTPEDFADVGCIAVKKIFSGDRTDVPSDIWTLTLDKKSKQNVLDAIAILITRDDIYCAEPNYIEQLPEHEDDEERAPVTGDAVIPVAFAMLCALGGMLAMRRKRIVK